MSDLFDEIFELGFEYAFDFLPVNDSVEKESGTFSHSFTPVPTEISEGIDTPQKKSVDLTCDEEINYNRTKSKPCSHHTPIKTQSHRDSVREYYSIVIEFIRCGGNANFVYNDDSCPSLGPYFFRHRGRFLLQTCISNLKMTKFLLKHGANPFLKDERGHNSYDYCKDQRIKDYILDRLRH